MDALLEHYLTLFPFWGLLAVIAIAITGLGKGADVLVGEAVTLSLRWNVPKMLVGATVVSLGTTLPETAVSVIAALKGQPGLALGNAVGSIICDTGLILGLSATIVSLPIVRSVVDRQGWIQLLAAAALVLFSINSMSWHTLTTEGGHFPQWAGWLCVTALAAYLWLSISWARKEGAASQEELTEDASKMWVVILKLAIGITLVVGASEILIPAAKETAMRLHVPQSVIAATLVAFGTSLPELVTAMTSIRRGHPELAMGNVIGADILNVLFVTGVAASVTHGGLTVDPMFFKQLYPAMLLIIIVFRVAVAGRRTHMPRWTGLILLTVYAVITITGYITE